MADTSDFRNGICLEFKNDLYTLVYFQHVKPGKGAAFVRSKLKSLTNGRVLEYTFNAGEKITLARVERRAFQFLYNDEEGYHFMNSETYDQIAINKELIDAPEFLKEGQAVEVIIHADTENILACELPQFVILEVTYSEPGMKGNTASGNVLKPIKLETGAEIMAPLFIETGEKIKIDTKERTYIERSK